MGVLLGGGVLVLWGGDLGVLWGRGGSQCYGGVMGVL